MTTEREKWEIVWLKLEHEQADLEYQIQALQAKLEIINSLRSNVYHLRATLEKMPDDMLPLLEPEAEEALLEAVRQKIEKEEGTHFQKIEKYFQSVGNRPATIADLEAATGIPRASLSAVLYRTHSEKFLNGESETSRAKLWWLIEVPPVRATSARPLSDPGTTFDDVPPEPRGDQEIPF